jgi:UDP-galactopyranose mutase
VVIAGAGFAGSVLAERLAEGSGLRVLVCDKRDHIGGNAYDHRNEAGILVHRYGPHIFHTNAASVFDYLSGFTAWRPYEHRVLACVRDRLVPIPINRTTINTLYGLSLRDEPAVEAFLAERAEPREPALTSEDVVVGRVGHELYELFFRGYTRKQWGLDPSQLDASVTARVPTRADDDDRYFTDRYQAMPLDGYTAMFERMLDRPGIDVRLGTDWRDVRDTEDYGRVVFTGPVDEYFDRRFGPLPYRSLRFAFETREGQRLLPVGTVNYPDERVPYTRITEFGHLTGRWGDRTTLVREYPTAEGDPYYPIPRPQNAELYKRYEALAAGDRRVVFVGRLATYRYYNMDQVVAQALTAHRRIEDGAEQVA